MKYLLKISLVVIISVILFSCSVENTDTQINDIEKITITKDNIDPFLKEVEVNFETNITFVDEFILKHKNGNLDKKSMLRMLQILKISKNMDLEYLKKSNEESKVNDFMDYLKNNPQPINESVNCSIDTQNINQRNDAPVMCERCCNRLVEVRDAMLDECNNYIFGLDEVCAGAVMIAYWYRSSYCYETYLNS